MRLILTLENNGVIIAKTVRVYHAIPQVIAEEVRMKNSRMTEKYFLRTSAWGPNNCGVHVLVWNCH